jgi:hypothetical protein
MSLLMLQRQYKQPQTPAQHDIETTYIVRGRKDENAGACGMRIINKAQ